MRAIRLFCRVNSSEELLAFLRLLFWAAYFRVMKRFVPLPSLVSRAVPTTKPHHPSIGPDRIAELGALAARVIRAGGDPNCLERSLTIYRQLIRSGARPALAVNFRRELHVVGHVWIVLGGKPFGKWDAASHAEPFLWFDETGGIRTARSPAFVAGGPEVSSAGD